MSETSLSNTRLGEKLKDAAIENINEDIHEICEAIKATNNELPKLQSQVQASFERTMTHSISLLTEQMDNTIGQAIRKLDESITNAESIKEGILNKAEQELSLTKHAFLSSMDQAIQEKTQPVFKALMVSTQEMERSIQTLKSSRCRSLLLGGFISMASAIFGAYLFLQAVKYGMV